MSRYNITVNDQAHVVDVEEVGPGKYSVTVDGAAAAPVAAPVAAAPAAAPVASAPAPVAAAPAPAPVAAPAVMGAGATLKAPMPGVIESLVANVGDTVNKGDTVLILEAMKMKNEIRAEATGKVASFLVAPGQQVKFGEVLVSFE